MTTSSAVTTAAVTRIPASQLPAYFLVFVGALIALGPLTMDAYLPALPTLADFFGVDIRLVSATVSTYLLGYSIGQFFGGPISDQIGRKVIGLSGLTLFLCATLGILFASSVEQVLVWRFVQALGGGFATVISMALVRDVFSPIEAGKRFAVVMMIVMLAPLVAPAVGTYLLHFGWHAIFWLFAIYALVLGLILTWVIPETNTGPRRSISLLAVFRQYWAVISHRHNGQRVAIRFPVAMALSGSVIMIFITQSAFLYMDYFQVSETWFPVLFGANVLVLIGNNFISMRLLGRCDPQAMFRFGMRFQLLVVAAFFLVVLFDLARLPVVVPLIMLSVGSMGLINPAGMTLYMSFFPTQGGSASAAFTTLMFSLGGLLGALPSLLPGHGLLPLASVMLAAILSGNLISRTIPPVSLDDAPAAARA